MDVYPWIEKYRPPSLNEIISHKDIVKSMKNFISSSSLPNILFHGPPGTGKTSVITACIKEMYGEDAETMVLDLNASEERGIDIVRNRIRRFVSSKNVFAQDAKHSFKIVILDEIDSMTDDAQCILRKIIEDNTKIARFCLICNYIHKINRALRSRCIKFKFKPLQRDKIKDRIAVIVENENINVEDDAIDTLIDRSNGDMRKVLNILQSTSAITDRITSDTINNCIGYPIKEQVAYVLKKLLHSKDRHASMIDLRNYINQHSLSLSDILAEVHNYLYENIEKYDPESVQKVFIKLKFIDINLSYNTNLPIGVATLTYSLAELKRLKEKE